MILKAKVVERVPEWDPGPVGPYAVPQDLQDGDVPTVEMEMFLQLFLQEMFLQFLQLKPRVQRQWQLRNFHLFKKEVACQLSRASPS